MKKGDLLFSAVQFLFIVLILLIGGCFLGLHTVSHARFALARLIEESPSFLFTIGCWTLGSGILLLIGFYNMHRGVYYRVRMKKGQVSIDPAIVRSYIDAYWKKELPQHEARVEVVVSGGHKLEVFVAFSCLPIDAQIAALEKAEPELSQILHKYLGYKKEFTLSVLVK